MVPTPRLVVYVFLSELQMILRFNQRIRMTEEAKLVVQSSSVLRRVVRSGQSSMGPSFLLPWHYV